MTPDQCAEIVLVIIKTLPEYTRGWYVTLFKDVVYADSIKYEASWKVDEFFGLGPKGIVDLIAKRLKEAKERKPA